MKYIKNRIVHVLRRIRANYLFRNSAEFTINFPIRKVRHILVRNNLGFQEDGIPTWWYASLDCRRNEADDLTKAALRYVDTHVPKDATILATGCGTGWMLFWLAQRGFRNLEGFDYLENVVQAAKEIAALDGINAKLWQSDGFEPKLDQSYDLILVLHWLYSAWMGNYGNTPKREDREQLLSEFLSQYAPHMEKNGVMLLELIDAISDFREPPTDIYPIRHSVTQVSKCAATVGLKIEKQMFNSNYGHLPRMLYFLRKD